MGEGKATEAGGSQGGPDRKLATTTPLMVTGFESPYMPPALRPDWSDSWPRLQKAWRWLGWVVLRYLGVPKGEGGATL